MGGAKTDNCFTADRGVCVVRRAKGYAVMQRLAIPRQTGRAKCGLAPTSARRLGGLRLAVRRLRAILAGGQFGSPLIESREIFLGGDDLNRAVNT